MIRMSIPRLEPFMWRSSQIAWDRAIPRLREHLRLPFICVERVGDVERLGVRRHRAAGHDSGAPLAARDRDAVIAALVGRERVTLADRERGVIEVVVLQPASDYAPAS